MEQINNNSSLDYALELYKLRYLRGPEKWDCGDNHFNIQVYNLFKTTGCCFRCNKIKCKKRYPIRINSFFENYSKISLELCSEIMKCFLCHEFNAKKAVEYIKNEKNVNVSPRVVSAVYKFIRNVIYKYFYYLYQSELLVEENSNKTCSIDESNFTYTKSGKTMGLRNYLKL